MAFSAASEAYAGLQIEQATINVTLNRGETYLFENKGEK
jgi:hypothetical protein